MARRNGSKKKRKVRGKVEFAEQTQQPAFAKNLKPRTSVQLAGLRYQKKASEYLDARYGDIFLPEPWYRFRDANGYRFCAPDVLIIPEDEDVPIILGDCKLTVTKRAKRELEGLYKPVVQFLYPNRHIRPVQIAHNLRRDWEGDITEDWDELFEGRKYITMRWRQ